MIVGRQIDRAIAPLRVVVGSGFIRGDVVGVLGLEGVGMPRPGVSQIDVGVLG